EALEFSDGKLMLGKHDSLKDVTWKRFEERLGEQRLAECFESADLVAIVNWTMMPHMTAIWREMLRRKLPGRRGAGRMFIDLADPEKRTDADLAEALGLLTKFQDQVDVTLGLNLKESLAVCSVLKLPISADPEEPS